MESIVVRMGILSCLKSKSENGKTVGIMITASHNPEEDNGIKICDSNGDMIDDKWEKYATTLVNIPEEQVLPYIKEIVERERLNISVKSNVALGYDTRKSSIPLSMICIKGIPHCTANLHNFGLVTTPQLHYLVHRMNLHGTAMPKDYSDHFIKAFKDMKEFFINKEAIKITVDAANGVGASQLALFKRGLEDLIDFTVVNDGKGLLNHGVLLVLMFSVEQISSKSIKDPLKIFLLIPTIDLLPWMEMLIVCSISSLAMRNLSFWMVTKLLLYLPLFFRSSLVKLAWT